MRSRKTNILITLFFLLLAGVAARWVLSPPAHPDGTAEVVRLYGSDEPVPITRRMTPEDAGIFTGPEDLSIRQQHLHNRDYYLSHAYDSIPTDPAEAARKLLPALRRELLKDPADRDALRRERADSVETLAAHVGAALANAGGAEFSDYLAALPPDRVVTVPENEGQLVYLFREHVDQRRAESPEALLRQLYDAAQKFDEGNNLASGWASGEEGLIAAARRVKGPAMPRLEFVADEYRGNDPRRTELSVGRWTGQLAESALVFNRPPRPLMDVLGDGEEVLLVNIAVLVKTRVGDAYPLHISCWRDPRSGNWWTQAAWRKSSTRSASGMPLIF